MWLWTLAMTRSSSAGLVGEIERAILENVALDAGKMRRPENIPSRLISRHLPGKGHDALLIEAIAMASAFE